METREGTQPLQNTELGFITGLEGALAEEKCALVAAEEESTAIKKRLQETTQALASAEDSLFKLQEEQRQLLQTFASARQQEVIIHNSCNEKLRQLSATADARRQASEDAIRSGQQTLEEKRKLNEDIAAKAEEAALIFREKQQLANTLLNDQEEQQRILQDEQQKDISWLEEQVTAAASRAAAAQVEHTAANKTNNLLIRSLSELKQAFDAVESDIQAQQEELSLLPHQQEGEESALRLQMEKELAVQKADEDEAMRVVNEKRAAREKAQNLVNLAKSSYLNMEEKAAAILQELRQVCVDAEKDAAEYAAQMENILHRAIAGREAYAALLLQAKDVDTQANELIQADINLREHVLHLRMEDHDLRNAALVAGNLAAEATVSRLNADSEMADTMIEMEQALIAAADEAKRQSEAKNAELAAAEAESDRTTTQAAQIRQQVRIIEQKIRQAEADCLTTEQEMLKLSQNTASAENNTPASSFDNRIRTLRENYDAAAEETTALKKAVDHANQNLRLAVGEAEKAERTFVETVRQTRQLHTKFAADIAKSREQRRSQIAEINAKLALNTEKRDKLQEALLKKQENLAESEAALQAKAEVFALEQQNLLETKQAVADATKSWQEKLSAKQTADATALQEIQQEAAQAAINYDRLLQDSLQAANNAQEALDFLRGLEQEQKELLQSLAEERKAAEKEAADARLTASEACRAAELAVNNCDNPIRLGELDIVRIRKQHSMLLAALELQKMRQERHAAQVEHLESEEASLVAAERKRLADEAAAAARAEQLRLEAQLRKEEEERQRREEEKRRLESEREAALIAAEAEKARMAAQRAEQEAAAEQAAVRMAAGEILSREENLALVESGELEQRMQRLREIAIAEAKACNFRWIKPEQEKALREEEKNLSMQAQQNGTLFESARLTLLNIMQQRLELKSQRHAMGPQWAARIYALYQAEKEYDALQRAWLSVQQAQISAGPAALPLLTRTLKGMEKTLASCKKSIKTCRETLLATEKEIHELEDLQQDVDHKYHDAGDLLYELACTWIYQQNQLMKVEAKLAEIDREQQERGAIQQAAEDRFAAARQAAAAISEQTQRIGSVKRATGPAARRKRR